MAIDFNIIGERLKSARISKKLTQENLAEKMDVSVTFLSRLERGSSHINLTRLSQICEILEVSEGEILNGSSFYSNSYLVKDFNLLLESCPPEKKKLIYEISKIIMNS